MNFDYSALRGKIKEKCGTQERFAFEVGMSRTTLSKKINNLVEFSQDEIIKTIKILQLQITDIPQYFFTLKVEKTKQ